MSARTLKVGDKVVIDPSGLTGVVKFQGPTKFAKGRWIGIQLSVAEGKNDGTVNGVRYFSCPPDHGLFVKPENVVKVSDMPSPSSQKPLSRGGSVASIDFDPNSLVLGTAHEDLFDAAKDYENFQFLKILVEEDNVPVTGTDQFGNTALHVVASQGGNEKCIKVLRYLLDKGLEPQLHARNIYGQTAVMCAALNKRWEVVQFLTGIGADVISKGQGDSLPSVWDCCQNIPAGMAALHGGMDRAKQLREEGKLTVPPMRHKQSTLLEALFKTAHAGDLKYVRMLLEERDLNVNATDNEGNTVLHWVASDPKRLPILKYLVAMGGRINIKNKIGDTCCLVAARSRAWSVMQYLISIGASISIKDEKNGKSVFKYAQANLTSRKALADGLAEKKRNNLTHIDADDTAHEIKSDELEREHTAEREAEKAALANAARDAVAQANGDVPPPPIDPPPTDDDDNPHGDDAASETSTPSTMNSLSSPRPGSVPVPNDQDDINENWATQSTVSDMDSFRNEAEVMEDLKNNGQPPPTGGLSKTAGTFSGIAIGKKKDRSKGKVCKVCVSENGVILQYKKGAWYKRKDCVEEYKWSDQMSLKKLDDTTLMVTLDPSPESSVILKISPCQPDTLEEFIWKHIWISVFEVSVSEAIQLFAQYEQFCNQTVQTLRDKVELRTQLQQNMRQIQVSGADEAKKMEIRVKQEQNSKEISDLLARFSDIRHQGETLIETFDKMYEALERRLAVEEQRKRDFSNKEMFHKAAEVKNDQEAIRAQLERVADDKTKVMELYESMKQTELQFSHIGAN